MKTDNASFIGFDNSQPGIIFDDSENKVYPLKYFNCINGVGVPFTPGRSYFIYCYEGLLQLEDQHGDIILKEGMFASIHNNDFLVHQHCTAKAIVIEVQNNAGRYKESGYKAYRTVGGPIEAKGRLKYIDGCTDSLLIPPVKKGDPCLNHLHFPSGIDQTSHTHPSHRIGIVAKGNGLCVTPFDDLDLNQGMIFVIKEWDGESQTLGLDGKLHPNGEHKFRTFSGTMDVIAFHPDSDFGAEDENHPMINRTMVNGVSANKLDEIRTK